MNYKDTAKQLAEYRSQIAALRKKMREAQSTVEPEDVKDYVFPRAGGGTARLSELFGDKDTLFIVHNMGASCTSCTMWADGFNGVFDHLNDCSAFVVVSPDAPEDQKKFAASRKWRFPMVSYQGNTFGEDMGYRPEGRAMPGVSVFRRNGDKIMRVADTTFSPGDDFCAVWHFFDLIPGGAAGWRPKYQYAS